MTKKKNKQAPVFVPKDKTRWMGSSQKDVAGFPEDVQDQIFRAILMAEMYDKAAYAEPMKGFAGSKVIDIKADHDDNCTYRCIYTIQYPNIVYVLHAFKKKSNQGIATPAADMRTLDARLKTAKNDNDARLKEKTDNEKRKKSRKR